MYTIAVANQKGGSGKTTTAVNFSAGLTMKGFRVLLIDLDPQAQASTFLRIEDRNAVGSVLDTMLETRTPSGSVKDLLVPIFTNLSLLPGEGISHEDEARLSVQPNRYGRLQATLEQCSNAYDFAVIDCPPTLGVLTRNALMAANAVLLTIETSFLALHGVSRMLEIVQEVRMQHALRVFAVATMYDGRTTFSREVLEDMRGYFDEMMLDTVIRQNVRLKESASHGEPIFSYACNSNGAADYKALTEEMLTRIVGGIDQLKNLALATNPDGGSIG